MLRSLSFILILFLLARLPAGCKKWVEVPPPVGHPSTEALFSSEASARGVLSGVYSELMSGVHFASSLTTLYSGLAADELYNYTPGVRDGFTHNELSEATHPLLSAGFWQPAYRFIYTANLVLEKLPGAPLEPAVKRTLLGEARFVRAFCYFHLVTGFGGVPLVRSTDYRATRSLPRSGTEAVWDFIVEDLREAEKGLPTFQEAQERLRPSREAAMALRARVHLYRGQWSAAAAAATELIGGGHFALAARTEEVFRSAGPETIFYLPALPPHYRLPEASAVLPASAAALPAYLVRPELLTAFEAGDRRRDAWIGSRLYGGQPLYYPAKYKDPATGPGWTHYTVLRLAELYLVRAEAFAHLGDVEGALADLNALRGRAGLQHITGPGPGSLLERIEKERRVELAFEWGHRWNDLRRTGRAGAVLGPLKGARWQATDTLWPLPGDQLRLNPALTQNPGY
jgi:hypothetical protein